MLYSTEIKKKFESQGKTLLHKWLFSGHKPYESLVEEIETQYEEIGKTNKSVAELKSRLTSKADSELHTSAIELYMWHKLQITYGYQVENHPQLPDKTTHPEFLVTSDDSAFYVEVRTLFDDTDQTIGMKTLMALKDGIKKALSGNAVHMLLSPEHLLAGDFPVGQAAKVISAQARAFIATSKKTQRINLSIRGVNFEVIFFKDSRGDGPTVDTSYQTAFDVSPRRPIEAIKKKAGKYGELDKPLVLVLDMPDTIRFNEQTLMRALFGEAQVTYDSATNTVTDRGQRDGTGVFKIATNRRLSAVMYHCLAVSDGDSHVRSVSLVHNPHTTNPIDPELFPGMRQFIPNKNDDGSVTMNWSELRK